MTIDKDIVNKRLVRNNSSLPNLLKKNNSRHNDLNIEQLKTLCIMNNIDYPKMTKNEMVNILDQQVYKSNNSNSVNQDTKITKSFSNNEHQRCSISNPGNKDESQKNSYISNIIGKIFYPFTS